jgi:TolA-binding protein
VVEELMSFLRDDRTEDAIVDCVMRIQEEENRALPLLEQQLREAEAGIENMLRAIQLGVLTKSTKTRLEELEAAKERLELEIAEEKIGKPLLTPKFVHSWIQRFTTKEKQSHHAAAFFVCGEPLNTCTRKPRLPGTIKKGGIKRR